MSLFKDKVNKALDVYKDMTLLINICKNYSGELDIWKVYWDSFWELSREFPFEVDWRDYNKSYEEDIVQRYNALTDFINSIYIAVAEGVGDE